jgi:hypothetical protein
MQFGSSYLPLSRMNFADQSVSVKQERMEFPSSENLSVPKVQ